MSGGAVRQDGRGGLLWALSGFALLSVSDGVIKTMSGEWSPIAVAALRFTIGASGLCALLLAREGKAGLKPSHPWLQLGRGFCMAAASLLFFSAIFVMPLAEATAIVFVAPVMLAVLSGPLLGETVPRETWVACALALVGVAIVLRPNLAEVGIAALLPLFAAFFFSLMIVGNRASAGQGSVLSMQALVQGIAAPILIVAACLGAASGFEALAITVPSPSVVARCALAALLASTAHWMVYRGTMLSGASTVAPMTYVQLLVATAIGWWWFGDRPDAIALLGAAIIILAGLTLWHAGRRPKRLPQAAPARR